MKSRFLLPFLSLFFTLSLFAQQDSIKITGIVTPTCSCSGAIDITVTGGISQPPGFFNFWSNGATTQDITNLCPGTYCVTVSGANGGGNTATACFVVPTIPYTPLDIVSSNSAPCNFDSTTTNDCERVCPGTTVTYSVAIQSPTGTGTQIGWQVSGATSWTVNNTGSPFFASITVQWGGPGTGGVTVFTDGNQTCSGEDFLCVTIIDAPKADFTSSPTAAAGGPLQVCLGQTVHFQNLSTGAADSFEWLFSDDQSISSVENPDHTYLNPGTYTVRLIARSSCLCADTTEMTVEVLNAQAPMLDCVATICPGETVTYTTSNACAPYTWSVSGNGTVLNGGTSTADSITVQWNNGPEGTITLSAQPCSGTACPLAGVTSIPILSSNAQIEGEERVCPGATEIYTIEPYGGTDFVWSLGSGGQIIDGQGTNRVTVQWSTLPNPAPAADHTLYVQYTNCYLGCSGSDLIHVRILSSFSVHGPLEVCQNANGSFTATLNYNSAGLLCNWTVIAPDGSQAWISPAPIANPVIPFLNGPGVYQVLAVPNDINQSCTSSAEWAVSVKALPAEPTGIIGETNICPGTAYTYEADGLSAGANIKWTFKNGAAAAQTLNGNPLNVTWGNTGGWLTAAQVSTDGLGCLSDTVGLAVTPIATPVISGTPVVCEDDKGSYSIPSLQNVDIQWSISPPTAGAVADGQGTENADIFWSQAGGHVVSVSVCGQTAQFPVTVLGNPVPAVQHPVGLCPGATALVQTSATFVNYIWKDENGAVLSNNASLMLGPGVYSVEVTDGNGCSGVSEFQIQSYDVPNVSLTTADPTGFCNNSYTVLLSALTNTAADYTFQWFHDGSLIAGASNATYSTNQYGIYSVEATNSYGCKSTAGTILLFNYCGGGGGCCGIPGHGNPYCTPGSIQLIPDPTPRCDSFRLVLNDYTGLYVAGSAQWVTGISGGLVLDNASGDDASFVYDNAGKYIVLVRVELSDGTVCEVLDSVAVEAVARFDLLPECPGSSTPFENRSEILPGSSITNYAWNFGDPASGGNNLSSTEDPGHVYANAGPYDVTLTVTALSGCTSDVTIPLDIPPNDPPTFADPLSKCAGNALEFIAAPNADIIEYQWDFGDPGSGAANDATGTTVYHSFTPGTYTVTATSKNVYGCMATYTRSIVVQPNGLSGNISPANPAPICEGSSITLNAPGGAVSYLWSSGQTTQSLTVNKEGTYDVTLTDANGCTYHPPTVKVEVNPSPDALIKALLYNDLGQVIGNSYPTATICAGEDLALQGVSNGAGSYSWSGGNGTDQVVLFTEDRGTLLPEGTHIFTVTVTSSITGCTAVSDPFLVTVNPVPSNFFISSVGYCAGSSNVISYNGPNPGNWQFFWNTGDAGTTLTTENPGSYYIRVINEFGCEAKSNVQTILPGPQVLKIPAGCHTRCKPDTLCIPNIPNIASWQWFLDGNPISGANQPTFIAQQSGTYWAELTDIFGCTATSDPLSLQLYDGYGNIVGHVWSDVNNNGVIDGADTLVSGITVVTYQNGVFYGSQLAGGGNFALTNVLSTDYHFDIDPFSLPFGWNIVIGSDQATLSGCDAQGTADMLLHFGCTAFGSLQLQACPGGTATYNGVSIPVGSSNIFHLNTALGCDSTLVVTVAPIPPSTGTLTLKACPGGSASYNGTNIPTGTSMNFTLVSAAGCDSILTVNVAPLAITTGTLTLKACPGQSATYNGTPIPVGSSMNFTLVNVAGCDSILTVTVAPLAPSSGTLVLEACAGQSATYNGTPIPAGSSMSFTLVNAAGCDSILTVTVNTLQPSSKAITLAACQGSSANYNGNSIPAGSTMSFTYANAVGCDSVVTVTVNTLLPSSASITEGVCPGEVFVYQGVSLQAGAVQQFTLTNKAGCDSIVTVNVFQKNNSSRVLNVDVCPGETFTYNGQQIAPGETREFHFSNAEQCDSTVTVTVSEYPDASFQLSALPSCQNGATGSLELSGVSGSAPFRFSLDQQQYQDSLRFVGLNAGNYTVYALDANGCLFTQNTVLEAIPELQVLLADGVLPCENPVVYLQPQIAGGNGGTLQYLWWDGRNTPLDTVVAQAGPVWVEVSDECGTVRSEASVKWAELPADPDIVYVPNIFSPDASDAENAQFRPQFAAGINLLSFQFEVYDRWGDLLFRTSNTADAWDGVFRSKKFDPGVQVWHLEADVAICGRVLHVQKKGDVTVYR